jgi:hypothetical protein
MKSKCESFNEDDMMCCDCAKASVEEKQGCYVKHDGVGVTEDKVHPDHYKLGDGREVIDVIRLMMTEDELRGFCKGNYLKYILRAGKKAGESAETDRKKAEWYLDYLEKLECVEFLPAGISELNFKYLDSAEKIEYRGHGVDKYVD